MTHMVPSIVVAATSAGSFLANAGAVAGGGAVFGATLGYVVGSILQAFGLAIDRRNLAQDGAGLGGFFGICIVVLQAAGVK